MRGGGVHCQFLTRCLSGQALPYHDPLFGVLILRPGAACDENVCDCEGAESADKHQYCNDDFAGLRQVGCHTCRQADGAEGADGFKENIPERFVLDKQEKDAEQADDHKGQA